MGTVTATSQAVQQILGPDHEELGRTTGLIQRLRKFSAVSLLRMIVLTLLKKPDPKPDDYRATAAQLGVDVSPAAIAKRFSPQLVVFLRGVLERAIPRVMVAAPATLPLLQRFTCVLIGDSTQIALPDACAEEFPGCGGTAGSGRAALKIQVLWDLLSGGIRRLLIEPGRSSDATSPIAQEAAPAGSLSVFDLGYFGLQRFRRLMNGGAFWISRLQHGTLIFDPDGQPLRWLDDLRQHTGSGPIELAVLLGATERLACRLIAVRAPQEVANRRRQQVYEKAQKHGRQPSREYLDWQDWTIFVTNCSTEQLTWKEVVVVYRARWQIELLFKLWKSHNKLAALKATATPTEPMALIYGKLIGVIIQHWILLSATWSEGRRSLSKAAAIIRDWITQLTEAIDNQDQMIMVLGRIQAVLDKIARVQSRKGRPSHFQLLSDPELLNW